MTTLTSLGLQKHVRKPTHKSGHMVDLLISRTSDINIISQCNVQRILESDHFVDGAELCLRKPKQQKITTTTRNYRNLNVIAFQQDICYEAATFDFDQDVNLALNSLESSIRKVMDKHAPVTTRTCAICYRAPWYNEQIHTSRRERRRLVRSLRKNKKEIQRQLYLEQHKLVKDLIKKAKANYYQANLPQLIRRKCFN